MMHRKRATIRLEDLLGKAIVSANGKLIGHVFDIQLSNDETYQVTALMYGHNSLLYRLHIYEPVARAFRLKRQPKTIPWEAVEHVERSSIRLQAGYDF